MSHRLIVREAQRDDVQKDTIRVHVSARSDTPRGSVTELTVNGRKRLVVARGLSKDRKDEIWIDYILRSELGLEVGDSYEFELQKSGFWGQIVWSWNHSDPGIRIATRIAIVLGLVGIVPSVIDLFR